MNRIPKTQCAACGKFFTSTSEFDRHRVGKFGFPPKHPHARRCDTAGWNHADMLVTGIGQAQVWTSPGYADRVQKLKAAIKPQ